MLRPKGLIALAVLTSCVSSRAGPHRISTNGQATIRTDSAQYTVPVVDGRYQVSISFVLTNATTTSISADYCKEPGPPILEKFINGRWHLAYTADSFLCQAVPPFILPVDGSHRGVLQVVALPLGSTHGNALRVDSIPGTYRLRWMLNAGTDPRAPGTSTVQAISNGFRLVDWNSRPNEELNLTALAAVAARKRAATYMKRRRLTPAR